MLKKGNSLRRPVVMVGVLPPPVHGQSLATKALFEADIKGVQQEVVEMRSSKDLDEVGKASISKVFGLFGIIKRVLCARFRSGADVLYYTAGSASVVPLVRDIAVLGCVRPFFRRTLIHYHSGGLPDYLESASWRRVVGKWVYGRGAWAISLSKHTPVPGVSFGAAKEIEIPNGLDIPSVAVVKKSVEAVRVLFIGNLYDDKGVFDLIDAVALAAEQTSQKIHLSLVGKFPDSETETRCLAELAKLEGKVSFDPPGPKYGDEKWSALAEADIFAFPTYYRSENLPLVVIEAMGMELPVVSTRWRGVPSLVQDGVNGYLSEPNKVADLAQSIAQLADDSELRKSMGAKSKELYQTQFTFARHIEKFAETFASVFKK